MCFKRGNSLLMSNHNKQEEQETVICIAIDGPSGAGKSSIAQRVAKQLGFLYVDTGAMYRALTLEALKEGINLNNEQMMVKLAVESNITLSLDLNNFTRVFVKGIDVTNKIRQPEVSRHVSYVARLPKVREYMVAQQQQIAKQKRVVMEGRDIGTVVLPYAQVKIFLTANLKIRARRRQMQLAEEGVGINLEQLTQEIATRDFLDSSRCASPLVPAQDAEVIDCSFLSIEQVVDLIVKKVKLCCKQNVE